MVMPLKTVVNTKCQLPTFFILFENEEGLVGLLKKEAQ